MSMKSDWITVGALADAFAPACFVLPNLADLVGKIFTLNIANGLQIIHAVEAERLSL